jgi:D-lactate dehydrogenase
MDVAVFSTKRYDREFLEGAGRGHDLQWHFLEPRLQRHTSPLAAGHEAICCFVNDILSEEVLTSLEAGGTRMIALRCAGYNNVDIPAADRLGIQVARVPAYSPYSVAEHALGMILTLNRKYHKAYNRIREGNFSLEGLLGFDLHGKTAGIVGTGNIGELMAKMLLALGCEVVAHDVRPNPRCEEAGVRYVELDQLFGQSDIISLHCPLLEATRHMINDRVIKQMKPGVMLINTSRGRLIDTRAVIDGLKSRQIGYLGIDVYEEEQDLFFENKSEQVIQDDIFQRLVSFPNVLVTGHQGFFTRNALESIARVTIENLLCFAAGKELENRITSRR